MTSLLRETVQHAELAKVADNIFEVTLITEGKGSSGTYSRELLSEFGPATFGPGVPNFFNHVGFWEDPSDRDIRTAAAKIEKSWYTDESGEGKVKAHIAVLPEHVDFVEFFMGTFGMSIFAEGTANFDEETGELMVESFNVADPYRSVDFVVAPGARGSIDKKVTENAPAAKRDKIMESVRFFESHTSPHKTSTASVAEKEETLTMEKDVQERFDALEAAINGLVSSKQEQAKTEADAAAVESAVTDKTAAIKTAVETVESAKPDLLPLQYKSLMERAWKGADVTSAIESDKAIALEAREAAKVETTAPPKPSFESGRFGEAASTTETEGYVFRGFGEAK